MLPRPALALVVLASPLLGAGFCGGGGFVPVPDLCDAPATGGVERLELSAGEGDFVPMADGAHLERVFGGQGSAMVAVRMRVFGQNLPECIAQRVSAWQTGYAGELVEYEQTQGPLRFYGDERERTTDAVWLTHVGYGDATLTSTVGGAHLRRRVVVD